MCSNRTFLPVAVNTADCAVLNFSAGLVISAIPAHTKPCKKEIKQTSLSWEFMLTLVHASDSMAQRPLALGAVPAHFLIQVSCVTKRRWAGARCHILSCPFAIAEMVISWGRGLWRGGATDTEQCQCIHTERFFRTGASSLELTGHFQSHFIQPTEPGRFCNISTVVEWDGLEVACT